MPADPVMASSAAGSFALRRADVGDGFQPSRRRSGLRHGPVGRGASGIGGGRREQAPRPTGCWMTPGSFVGRAYMPADPVMASSAAGPLALRRVDVGDGFQPSRRRSGLRHSPVGRGASGIGHKRRGRAPALRMRAFSSVGWGLAPAAPVTPRGDPADMAPHCRGGASRRPDVRSRCILR